MRVQNNLIKEYAEAAANVVSHRVIEDLKDNRDTLSGDDSGLVNVWEEICAQVQGEDSVEWELYREVIEFHVQEALEILSEQDKAAVWMQSENGRSWLWDIENPVEEEIDGTDPNVPSIPFTQADLVDYIVNEYIFVKADSYSNENIDRYLSGGESDEPCSDDEYQHLIDLMPTGSIVNDLWDWDIRFEEVFDDIKETAFGSENEIMQSAERLAANYLGWIDEYDMDMGQEDWPPGEFEKWIKDECLLFMKTWRQNVKNEFE